MLRLCWGIIKTTRNTTTRQRRTTVEQRRWNEPWDAVQGGRHSAGHW